MKGVRTALGFRKYSSPQAHPLGVGNLIQQARQWFSVNGLFEQIRAARLQWIVDDCAIRGSGKTDQWSRRSYVQRHGQL
jgi:hypothetical protein